MITVKKSISRTFTIFISAALLLILSCQSTLYAQDKNTPVSDTYISGVFLENQTAIINDPATTEMVINHRFGPFNSGHELAWGLYSSANIRVGLNHVFKTKCPVLKDMQFGIGATRDGLLDDGSIKWAIFRQTTNNKIPVSVTFYGAMYYDGRTTAKITNNSKHTFYEADRLSYFSELMISRKFGNILNVQVAPMYAHYNLVPITNPIVQQDSTGASPDGIPVRKNGNWGISVLARLKLTSSLAFMCEYEKNFTKLLNETAEYKNPRPNIALGLEMSTSTAHSFQLFVTTSKAIAYQKNMTFGGAPFAKDGDTKSGLMLGFNITRVFY